jgi:hypothetical protein
MFYRKHMRDKMNVDMKDMAGQDQPTNPPHPSIHPTKQSKSNATREILY